MNNPKYSIVVPVYKVEKYLNKCVDSILTQSFEDFELILVDDGSPDRCPVICDEYNSKDDRVVVIHKKNGGLSDARNKGIEVAKGEYVIFIDSDDYWTDDEVLSKIDKKIDKNHPDVLVYGLKKEYENLNRFEEKKHLEIKGNYDDFILLEKMIQENYFKACAWDKVVKRELIEMNHMRFPINTFSEDISWCANIIKYAKKYDILNENVYVYLQREGSITKKITNKNIEDVAGQIETLVNYTNEDKETLFEYLAYEYAVLLGLMKTKAVRKQLDKNFERKIYDMKWLLKYDKSNKVNKVKTINKFVGIKTTSRILGRFIDMKG